MFIFNIFFGLIGLAFSLLLLPLKLIRLPIAVILGPVMMVFHLITRHMFLVIILVLGLFIWLQFREDRVKLPELTPAVTDNAAPKGQKNIPIIQPVMKKEDGDSNFATDLYASMTEPERAQYSQNFYGAMSSLPNGQVHSWTFYNIAGSIRANDTFTNNSGVRCRHFTEVLKVHTIQQTLTGAACDQGNGAWCKLKPNATAACNLGGSSGGFFDSISRSLGNLF